jgi:hypothetical protein
VCDDATFCRRAYFDAHGLPPTEAQLAAFLNDTSPDKRTRLVDTLLADNEAYAEGWMAWWCDLLRNDEQTNIDNLRKPIRRCATTSRTISSWPSCLIPVRAGLTDTSRASTGAAS